MCVGFWCWHVCGSACTLAYVCYWVFLCEYVCACALKLGRMLVIYMRAHVCVCAVRHAGALVRCIGARISLARSLPGQPHMHHCMRPPPLQAVAQLCTMLRYTACLNTLRVDVAGRDGAEAIARELPRWERCAFGTQHC